MKIVTETTHVEFFGQLQEILQGWQTVPVQLSSGRLGLVVSTAFTSDFGVLQLALAPRVADRSVVHAGTLGFVLVERPMVWCGIDIVPPALKILRSGREMRSVLEAGFRSLEFYFHEADIVDHPLGQRLAGVDLSPERAVVPLSGTEADGLRGLGATLLAGDLPDIDGGGADALVVRAVRDRLLDRLDTVLSSRSAFGLSSLDRRRGALTAGRVLEVVDALGHENVSLTDLQAGVGVGRRAVEAAFRHYLGISPAQYLLARRLTAVRENLLGSGGSVYERALEAGFQDPSRFAQQYRRLFGELPSSTLKRYRDRD